MAEEVVLKKHNVPLQCSKCRSFARPFIIAMTTEDITVQCQKRRCKHEATFSFQSLRDDALKIQLQQEEDEKNALDAQREKCRMRLPEKKKAKRTK